MIIILVSIIIVITIVVVVVVVVVVVDDDDDGDDDDYDDDDDDDDVVLKVRFKSSLTSLLLLLCVSMRSVCTRTRVYACADSMCSCVCSRVSACARVRGHKLRALPARSKARSQERERPTNTCTLAHTKTWNDVFLWKQLWLKSAQTVHRLSQILGTVCEGERECKHARRYACV